MKINLDYKKISSHKQASLALKSERDLRIKATDQTLGSLPDDSLDKAHSREASFNRTGASKNMRLLPKSSSKGGGHESILGMLSMSKDGGFHNPVEVDN